MQRRDFAYDLPPELIAQTPLSERSASRLLVLGRGRGDSAARDGSGRDDGRRDSADCDSAASGGTLCDRGLRGGADRDSSAGDDGRRDSARPDDAEGDQAIRDCSMRDFPALLRPGDLLVFNDTKVVAARLLGTKPSGGRVEIFLERVVATDEAFVQLRASKPIREGLEVTTAGGVVRILGRQDDLWRVGFPGPAFEFFERWGEVPLPPYIHRAADANDRERYQSIFARERGAVAAPTASLHFDDELVREIEARGVGRAFVTLHVGAGTFQPVRTDDLEAHVMHAEHVSVGAEACEAIERTRAAGGRVIAIGTTVVRALEAAALGRAAASAHDVALAQTAVASAHDVALAQTAVASAHDVALAQTSTPSARDATLAQTAAASAHHAALAQTAAASADAHVAAPAAPAQRTSLFPLGGWSGDTRLFIRPGFNFQVTDALLTNFHLPESTLLMLVCAFAGKDSVIAAYEHAVRAQYRFFSYGDAMFLTNVNASAKAKAKPGVPG